MNPCYRLFHASLPSLGLIKLYRALPVAIGGSLLSPVGFPFQFRTIFCLALSFLGIPFQEPRTSHSCPESITCNAVFSASIIGCSLLSPFMAIPRQTRMRQWRGSFLLSSAARFLRALLWGSLLRSTISFYSAAQVFIKIIRQVFILIYVCHGSTIYI